MNGGRKIDQMKAAIAENRRKAGEQPAQKPVNPMPIDRRPKKEQLPETNNCSGKKALKVAGCDKKDAKMARRERLPDGSEYRTNWIAADEKWYGSLYVWHTFPDGRRDRVIFENQATGVFRLLQNLDQDYRRWLKDQKS